MTNDLRRLVDEGDDATIDLLRSAEHDVPSAAARAKTMAALNLGAGAGTWLGASQAKGLWGIAWKWIGVAVLGSGVIVATVATRHHEATAPAIDIHATNAAPIAAKDPAIAAAPKEEPAPEIARAPIAPQVNAVQPALAKTMPAITAPSARTMSTTPVAQGLSAELASLDAIRSAVAAGRTDAALDQLTQHERAFPNGALAQEATMLRIEALMTKGDATRARKLGKAFIAAHPDSAYVDRVHTLLQESPSP